MERNLLKKSSALKWSLQTTEFLGLNESASLLITDNQSLLVTSSFGKANTCFLQEGVIPFVINYASPISGEAYRNRRLTTNFELWVEIFCVPTCFHMRIPKPCLSVCPSVCLSVCPHPEKRYHHSFVNISPTLVIDTSMERSSQVLHHGNPKIWFFFPKKFEIRILTFDEELKSP